MFTLLRENKRSPARWKVPIILSIASRHHYCLVYNVLLLIILYFARPVSPSYLYTSLHLNIQPVLVRWKLYVMERISRREIRQDAPRSSFPGLVTRHRKHYSPFSITDRSSNPFFPAATVILRGPSEGPRRYRYRSSIRYQKRRHCARGGDEKGRRGLLAAKEEASAMTWKVAEERGSSIASNDR